MTAKAVPGATLRLRRRLALVIGIGDYENVSKLKSSQNDAKELSFLLQRIGFIIDQPQLDKKLAQMKQILVDFENSIQSNDVVLFYFAGHGMQWEDQNYLMLKDFSDVNTADSKAAAEFLKMNAINAHDILNALSARKPYAIIFLLDCCKNYSLKNLNLDKRALNGSDSKLVGLTGMHKTGSLIAFACAPGKLADDSPEEQNSLFMKHLLKHIATPNENIVEILRDVVHEVMKDSNSKQIPFMSVQLSHKNIYMCEQAPVVSIIPINAQWSQNGVTVAGGHGRGDDTNQLNRPWGLFVDDDGTMFITDWYNERIIQWKMGDKNGQVVAGGHSQDNWNHRVMKWNKGAKEGIVVAGGQGEGNALTQLSYPKGLFVDTWGTIYVVDAGNDRVMRWPKGAKEGTVLVGGNGKGQEANQLSAPMGLSLDRHGNLYVVDQQNHRVQQFSIKQTHCDA
ncbi:unnamed protein product [Rotaria sp. Silwood1]|nr:unnamed protein product [Rotaria sp. Silwood1]CAF1653251.1 unnamed protein product [Rotaria sp. Silwood1]